MWLQEYVVMKPGYMVALKKKQVGTSFKVKITVEILIVTNGNGKEVSRGYLMGSAQLNLY